MAKSFAIKNNLEDIRIAALIVILFNLIVNLSCTSQQVYKSPLPSNSECVYLVDTIEIPNSLIFQYRGNYYVCDSAIINSKSIVEQDLDKIISNPNVFHIGRYDVLELPKHLVWEVVEKEGKNELKSKLMYKNEYSNDLYCKLASRHTIRNKKNKEYIDILSYRRNPIFYNMYLMNVAYYDSVFVYGVFDGTATPLKSAFPSNRYIRIVYPVCEKCVE